MRRLRESIRTLSQLDQLPSVKTVGPHLAAVHHLLQQPSTHLLPAAARAAAIGPPESARRSAAPATAAPARLVVRPTGSPTASIHSSTRSVVRSQTRFLPQPTEVRPRRRPPPLQRDSIATKLVPGRSVDHVRHIHPHRLPRHPPRAGASCSGECQQPSAAAPTALCRLTARAARRPAAGFPARVRQLLARFASCREISMYPLGPGFRGQALGPLNEANASGKLP
jgi:hypothetical protein